MKVIMPVWAMSSDIIDLTQAAVDSIRQAKDTFIILIDNGSEIGGGALREMADLYIRNKTNLGYAKAVNQGLKLCNIGEIVCVANNDIKVPPNWQEVSLDILKDDSVGSVHFRMIPYNQPFNPGKDTWVEGKERWCTSSFFVLRNVQLYDENFLNSYDDWDFWKRFREACFSTAYTNRVEYQHLDSTTVQRLTDHSERDKINREYFKQKHGIYPEDDFEAKYPGMLSMSWKPMP